MQELTRKVVFFFAFLYKNSIKNAFLVGFGEQFGEQKSPEKPYVSRLSSVGNTTLHCIKRRLSRVILSYTRIADTRGRLITWNFTVKKKGGKALNGPTERGSQTATGACFNRPNERERNIPKVSS